MIKRSVCLYKGEYIGIESIFSVIDGKQINIAGKVEELHKRSRNRELFCPCGCGANLQLVAGDRGERAQHFRIWEGKETDYNCHYTDEGEEYVNTKIVLKCWLDDKLKTENIQCNKKVSAVDESDRKYEYTVYAPDYGIGICYWKNRFNIDEDKIEVLDSAAGKVIYIADIFNKGTTGQYPEHMMKIQKTQGFNLYLKISGKRNELYNNAVLCVTNYVQNRDGYWDELLVCEGLISSYDINSDGEVVFDNKLIKDLCSNTVAQFEMEEQEEAQRRKIEEETRKRLEAEEKKRRRIQQEEEEKERERRQRENEKLQRDFFDKVRAEEERRKAEKKARNEAERQKKENDPSQIEFMKRLPQLLSNRKDKAIDPYNERWCKCEICGKVEAEKEFISVGRRYNCNLGICKECSSNGKQAEKIKNDNVSGKSFDELLSIIDTYHNRIDMQIIINAINEAIKISSGEEMLILLPKITEFYRFIDAPEEAIYRAKHITKEYGKIVYSIELLVSVANAQCDINEIGIARKFADIAKSLPGGDDSELVKNIYRRLQEL